MREWFSASIRRQLQCFAGMVFCNPFIPERMDWERKLLGKSFQSTEEAWSRSNVAGELRENVVVLGAMAKQLADQLRDALQESVRYSKEDWASYEDLIAYHLYEESRDLFLDVEEGRTSASVVWDTFYHRYCHYLPREKRLAKSVTQTEDVQRCSHWFSGMFQIQRAFGSIFNHVVGRSASTIQLRAAIWESIFTWNMRAYRDGLYSSMRDFATLVTGPSGTGKELVAQAIALACYIPFDVKQKKFVGESHEGLVPLNLSALSPTLIESELFGHRRGAFTGAVENRVGYLESCPLFGSVFLDEIGELDSFLQVKLLRVLQSRSFQRLGETKERRFEGKVIAATNRDLRQAVAHGTFREDFYYRLCSDTIEVPSLRQRLQENDSEIADLVHFLLFRLAGESAVDLEPTIVEWIRTNLGKEYGWPGNIRELEQVIRNYLIRRDYQPLASPDSNLQDPLLKPLSECRLTADDLIGRYCWIVYQRLGSYQRAAEQLGLDRRTVKQHVLDYGATLSPS